MQKIWNVKNIFKNAKIYIKYGYNKIHKHIYEWLNNASDVKHH